MLSQFTETGGHSALGNLYDFPPEVYPVGRLDADSEGLLLLTDDKSLTEFLLNPVNRHEREYRVQVEGIPDGKELVLLEQGIMIKGKKTRPAHAELIPLPVLPQRDPPVRFRKNINETWLKIILTEGKNRQVRRMTAAIGYPTLRLVRVRIENISLENMEPGEVRKLSQKEITSLLGMKMAVK